MRSCWAAVLQDSSGEARSDAKNEEFPNLTWRQSPFPVFRPVIVVQVLQAMLSVAVRGSSTSKAPAPRMRGA